MKSMHELLARLPESARKAFRFLARFPLLAAFSVFVGTLIAGLHFCKQGTVHVQIRLDAPIPGGVQVYYLTDRGQGFFETRCVSARPVGIPAVADVYISARQLYGLRIDFGSNPGAFSVLDGVVGNISFPPWRKWSFSPDVELRGDIAESAELKLFSDKADPFMSVRFRRPILSSPHPKALSRERLLFAVAIAFAFAVVTGMVLSQRLRTSNPFPSGCTGVDFSWICLLFAMVFFFFVGDRMAGRGCDMAHHIAVANSIEFEELREPLTFWRHHFYPMWHLLVKSVKLALPSVSSKVAAGLVNGFCYNACLIGIFLFLKRKFRNVEPCGLIGMAFAVCIVGGMLAPGLDIGYLFENTHNAWWNPTNPMVMTLALPCVLLTARLWDGLSSRWTVRMCASPDGAPPDRRSRVPWPQMMALGLLLALTELAKPSFIQVYLPALFLFFAGWLLIDRKSIVPSLLLSLALIAPCIIVISQYTMVFDAEGAGGIGFGFRKVAGHYDFALLNQFYAIAFPVAGLVVAILRRKVHTEDVLCWLMLLVGLGMKWFLFERGPRMMDGNLGWGSKVAIYLVWVTSIRQYVDLSISQKGRWHRLGFWAMSVMLVLHAISGFYKLYDMICVGSGI